MYLGLLGAYAAWRLVELAVSRRHERALAARGVPRRRERGFGWMVAAHLVPFTVGPLEWWLRPPAPRALVAASLAALAGAAALRLWALSSLGERWTVRVHAAPAMAIVDRGPYRFVRHPNYAAVIVELAALPLAGGCYFTALAASALDAVALARRITDEEAALAASPAWRATMAAKPRFFPRLGRRAVNR